MYWLASVFFKSHISNGTLARLYVADAIGSSRSSELSSRDAGKHTCSIFRAGHCYERQRKGNLHHLSTKGIYRQEIVAMPLEIVSISEKIDQTKVDSSHERSEYGSFHRCMTAKIGLAARLAHEILKRSERLNVRHDRLGLDILL